MKKTILILLFLVFNLYADNIRSIIVDSLKSKDTVKTITLPEINTKPKTLKVKYINSKKKKNEKKVIKKTKEKIIKTKILLGEQSDSNFIFNKKINYFYEKSDGIHLKKISLEQYVKLLDFIKKIYNDKLYTLILNEIDKLSKNRLPYNERERLLFIKILSNIKNNKYDDSLTILDEIDKNYKKTVFSPYRYFYRGKLLILLNKNKEAIIEFIKLYKLYPNSKITDDALYELSNCYIKENQFDKAINTLTLIYKKYPTSDFADDALFKLAELYDYNVNVKSYKKALFFYRKLYNNYPKSKLVSKSRTRGKLIQNTYM